MPIIEGALKRQPAVRGAGAPTANVTGLGYADVGDLYLNTTNGSLYSVSATNKTSTITWLLVATQT